MNMKSEFEGGIVLREISSRPEKPDDSQWPYNRGQSVLDKHSQLWAPDFLSWEKGSLLPM